MKMPRIRAEGGFTALEAMLGVVLLAVGTTAAAGLILAAASAYTYSKQGSDAATLAEQTEEEYRDMPFASMAAGTTTTNPVVGTTTYTVTSTVQVGVPSANENSITITVQWGAGDANHTYQTQTILAALQG